MFSNGVQQFLVNLDHKCKGFPFSQKIKFCETSRYGFGTFGTWRNMTLDVLYGLCITPVGIAGHEGVRYRTSDPSVMASSIKRASQAGIEVTLRKVPLLRSKAWLTKTSVIWWNRGPMNREHNERNATCFSLWWPLLTFVRPNTNIGQERCNFHSCYLFVE